MSALHGEEIVIGGDHELANKIVDEHNDKARKRREAALSTHIGSTGLNGANLEPLDGYIPPEPVVMTRYVVE